MSSLTSACCTLPPVKHDYTPTGTKETVGDLEVYLAGPKDAPAAIVFICDIFGFTPQAYQVADLLAAGTGFRVAMPGVLRDGAWSLDNFPPPDMATFMGWIGSTASWDDIVKRDVPPVVDLLKAGGAQSLGIIGFCWGGKVACRAAAVHSGTFGAVASPHYSFLEAADLEALTCPVALLPSKDEAPEGPLLDVLKSKPFFDKCIMQRFPDMHHGWVGARGDFSDPQQAQRATEALQIFSKFFKDNLA